PFDQLKTGEARGRIITKTVTSGHPIMADVTAMGCVASALCAAMLAKGEQPIDAAYHAMLAMGECGERAAAKCFGTGSFNQIFIDELYNLTLTTDSDF
ncbi:MAG: hydroxyethylthiazole kinase, partial [Prevotellaceae bacterium]|nr:hydroxyethylthiazole kinase [Prevotellaceae bacterium]